MLLFRLGTNLLIFLVSADQCSGQLLKPILFRRHEPGNKGRTPTEHRFQAPSHTHHQWVSKSMKSLLVIELIREHLVL